MIAFGNNQKGKCRTLQKELFIRIAGESDECGQITDDERGNLEEIEHFRSLQTDLQMGQAA